MMDRAFRLLTGPVSGSLLQMEFKYRMIPFPLFVQQIFNDHSVDGSEEREE